MNDENELNNNSNNNINNNNEELKNLNFQKINNIILKLQESYKNLEGGIRINSFQKILNSQDIILILYELEKKNLEEIVVYILNEFSIVSQYRNDNSKESFFKDLYLLSIKKGQINILESLDKQDLNFNQITDSEGNNGLILAVLYSNLQIAKFFLKRCPEMLDSKNNLGYSPLLISVYNNDNLMFFLLATNLNNTISDGRLLCELAIRNENLEILNYLNPETNKSKCNYLPSPLLLHFASCQTNLDIFNTVVKMVKKYDHKIQNTLEIPLHWAVMKGNFHIVKALINLYKENQIGLDQKNLISALDDVKWLKYIIKKFNVNCYMKNNKGDTPFIHAILNGNYRTVEFFIDLFKNNKGTVYSNLNGKNKFGQTPLHAAVFTGNIKIIELLLKNKADISICDVNELTPYHYAYIDEKENVIKCIHDILGIDKSNII